MHPAPTPLHSIQGRLAQSGLLLTGDLLRAPDGRVRATGPCATALERAFMVDPALSSALAALDRGRGLVLRLVDGVPSEAGRVA